MLRAAILSSVLLVCLSAPVDGQMNAPMRTWCMEGPDAPCFNATAFEFEQFFVTLEIGFEESLDPGSWFRRFFLEGYWTGLPSASSYFWLPYRPGVSSTVDFFGGCYGPLGDDDFSDPDKSLRVSDSSDGCEEYTGPVGLSAFTGFYVEARSDDGLIETWSCSDDSCAVTVPDPPSRALLASSLLGLVAVAGVRRKWVSRG